MKSEKNAKKNDVKGLGDAPSFGDIKVSHAVVGSIVRLSALEVEGVYSVGGGIIDGITEIFSKRESDRGVKISEDGDGRYAIDVRVILFYGVDIAKVALQIQQNVRTQIRRMTMKDVASVDIIVDGIKVENTSSKGDLNELAS
jgi:uncharacterized alkaline shock family protein YloU